MTENKGDLISREALKEHKFVGNKFVQIGGRNNGKTLESINKAYQQGWNDCIDAIIDNAPTVDNDFHKGYAQGYVDGRTSAENSEGTWIYQDYTYTCSNCGNPALEQEDYPYLSSYCPFCGAEMEIEL